MYFFDLVDYYSSRVIGDQYEEIPICDVTWCDMATTARATRDSYFKTLNQWYLASVTCLEDGDCKDAILAKWLVVQNDMTLFINALNAFWGMMCNDDNLEDCTGEYNPTLYQNYINAQKTLQCDIEELTYLVDGEVIPPTTCQVGEFCDIGPLFVTYPLPRIDTLDDISKEPTFEELDNYDGTEENEDNISRDNYTEYFNKLIENLEYKTYGYSDNELPNDLTSLQQYFTDPNNNTVQHKVGFNDVNFMWWRKLTDYPQWTENQIVQTYFSGVEYFNFLPPVDDISLAPTGVAGDAIIVKQPGNIGDIYTWLPSINDWVEGDPADILGVLTSDRDFLRDDYNQTILTLLRYLYAANYLPKYQITKYKNF